MTIAEVPTASSRTRVLRPSVEGVTPIAKAVAAPAPAKLEEALRRAELRAR